MSKTSTNSNHRRLEPSVRLPGGAALRRFSAEEQQNLRRRAVEPIECVLHSSFRRTNAEERYISDLEAFLETVPLPQAPAATRSGKAKALTGEEERELFLRLNYCRYRTMRILRQFAGKRLSAEAAAELLVWDSRGERVRDRLVNYNLGLVPTMIERSRITGVDFADLISEGQFALLRSIDKFDCARGFKFSTYACRAIITSITRAVALMARHRTRFPTEYDPDLQKSDFVESRRSTFEDDCLEELSRALRSNAAALSQPELQVLGERFNVGPLATGETDAPFKTLRQVAETFGVTKERVRQIQNRALDKLRITLAERVFVH